ncbi:MAG TPA: aminoglycoside phosphotransferase family protein [Chloroflexota bacterium]
MRYLADRLAPGGRVARYRPLRGGVSASVYLAHLRTSDGGRRTVVVRRYAAPWHRADSDLCHREFRVLDELGTRSFPAPRPLLVDSRGDAFGAPTLVITRLPGRPVVRTESLDNYLQQMASTLVELHNLPIDAFHFLPEQTALLSNALGQRPPVDEAPEPGLREVVLREWPEVSASPSRRTLVHGDYWPGNLLWQRGRLVGVVDWEDACLGDPVRDVAICRGDLTLLFGLDAADAFLRHYEAAAGRSLSTMPFWDRLTCTLALPELDRWLPGWQALGRPDLTLATARERFRSLAHAALSRP